MNSLNEVSRQTLISTLGPLSTDFDSEQDDKASSRSQRAQAEEAHGVVQRLAADSGSDKGSKAGLKDVVGGIERDSASKIPFQAQMEQAFGHSFDHVQAYSGGAAREACNQLNADAFTVGNRIAFGNGSPDKETVAHELAHVVQQSSATSVQTKLSVGRAGGSLEKEATDVAAKVVQGKQVDVSQLSTADAGTVSRAPRQTFPELEAMWAAHPHNYQDDEEENTSSEEVNKNLGWDPDRFANTCAIRLSIMLNQLGGDYKISRKKAAKAGLNSRRVVYSKTTKNYYILSAREIWEYVTFWFGSPSKRFPARGRYKNSGAFEKAWTNEIKEYVQSKKGFVAFEKIFGYSGTGHVDIFDGETLSDASNWYPSKRLSLWFV